MMEKRSHGLIDTHAHLTFPDYDQDREEALERAWKAGLEAVVVIGVGESIEVIKKVVEFAEAHENVYATVGVHPHDAGKVDLDSIISELKKLAGSKKVVAIGEIGLDYYKNKSPAEAQRKCFMRFLELSSELKLPVSIHDREAHKDVLYAIRESHYDLAGGIFHCFSGDVDLAREVLEMGFYIAIPGIITFKNAGQLRDVVKAVPIEHLVVETDCPYLAPEPHRGKRNEPAYTVFTAKEIAKLKGLSEEDVARITTINARRAYNLPGMLPAGKIAYSIRKSLYLNLTNRCTLACTFCPKRSGNFEVKGHNLKLAQEPNVEDVFRAIGNCEGYDEVVFCGFGEPTLRLELLKVVAKKVKERGIKVRLDTDGLMNIAHDRDALPELKGIIDSVSVSMNAPDAGAYTKICPSKHGEKAFSAMLAFLKEAKKYIPEVTATAVDIPGIDINACKKLAKELNVTFRLRQYQEVG